MAALDFPLNPTNGQIHTNLVTGSRFEFRQGAWHSLPKQPIVAFSLSDFEARRVANQLNFPENGFVEWGARPLEANVFGDIRCVNEGNFCWQAIQQCIFFGSAAPTIEDPLSQSQTHYPIVTVNGVHHYLACEEIGSARAATFFGTIVLFPKGEKGTRCYDTATGILTEYATPALAFAAETSTRKVLLSRKDLAILETWTESVSVLDVVFPFGNVQWGLLTDGVNDLNKSTYKGLQLVNNIQPSGYSSWMENQIAELTDFSLTTVGGFGMRWSTASAAERSLFLSDPTNNMFVDQATDVVYQRRFRIRVIKGLGEDWDCIDTQSNNIALRYDSFNFVKWQATSTSPVQYTDLDGESYWGGKTTNTYKPSYTAYNPRMGYITEEDIIASDCKAIPLFLVTRRNTGVYDPVHNPQGTSYRAGVSGDGAGYEWYEAGSKIPLSRADCFKQVDDGGDNTVGNIAPFGYTPDFGLRDNRLSSDAIWVTDIKDLRNYVRDPIDLNGILDAVADNDWLEEAPRFHLIGYAPPEVMTFAAKQSTFAAEGSDNQYIYFDGDVSSRIEYLDNITIELLDDSFHNQDTMRVKEVLYDNINDVTRIWLGFFDSTDIRHGGWVTFSRKAKHYSRLIEYKDVHGHPDRYPREWTGVIDYPNSVGVGVFTAGTTVLCDGGSLGGIVGNVYKCIWTGAPLNITLNSIDWSADAGFMDMGVLADFQKQCAFVTPVQTDQFTKSFQPDGTLKTWKPRMRRQEYSWDSVTTARVFKSSTRGVEWVDITGDVDTGLLVGATNGVEYTLAADEILCYVFFVEASPWNSLESAVLGYPDLDGSDTPDAVVSPNIYISCLGQDNAGAKLSSHLCGQYPDGDFDGVHTVVSILQQYLYVDNAYKIGHLPVIGALAPASSGIRCVYSLWDRNGEWWAKVYYESLRYDVTNVAYTDNGTTCDDTTGAYTKDAVYKVIQSGSGLQGKLLLATADLASTVEWSTVRLLSGTVMVTEAGDVLTGFELWVGSGWGVADYFVLAGGVTTQIDHNGLEMRKGQQLTRLPWLKRRSR